jgi:hypothetical protein
VAGDVDIEQFERDGYLVVPGAVPADVVAACRAEIDDGLRARGVDPADASTWTDPVVRIWCPETPPFAAAGSQPVLWDLYDRLLGAGTWWRRMGVGGSVPVRFPHPDDPGDAGWHIDGSFEHEGAYWVNVRSANRGLLALFLFSDVGEDDAPTELKVGSHVDIPPVLATFGDDGARFDVAAAAFPKSVFSRPSALATGSAGDVFVCHPFLVHRATWPHRGRSPRVMAQPGVALLEPFPLDGRDPYPVERAILAGLAG